MRSNEITFPLVASGITAFALVTSIFLTANVARAGDGAASTSPPSCSCPNSGAQKVTKPRFAGLTAPMDESDEIATLESVHFALAEVADGSSYVWHRSNGRLSGVVKPISSYKSENGSVCRHLLVILSTADLTKTTKTVACRQTGGAWKMEG